MKNTFRITVCHECGHEGNYKNTRCTKCATELTDENIVHKNLEIFY